MNISRENSPIVSPKLERGIYFDWLHKKGYSEFIVKKYDRLMRRVQEEGLTIESVGLEYENYSRSTKEGLRRGIRLLDEKESG